MTPKNKKRSLRKKWNKNNKKAQTLNKKNDNGENEENLETDSIEIQEANIFLKEDEDNSETTMHNTVTEMEQNTFQTANASEVPPPCTDNVLGTKTNPPREEYMLLNIIGKIAEQLKLNDGGFSLKDLLEMLLTATNIGNEKQESVFRILELFLEILEHSNLEDLKAVSAKIKTLFIPRQLKELTIEGSELGSLSFIAQGGFGTITKGILRRPDGSLEQVAIKSACKEENEPEIENEARALSQLVHKNVVRLLAFQKNPMKIALEFMDKKDFTEVLKEQNISDKQLLNMLLDVACGMEYVADKKFVHRDLACRNIFVNSRLECKIGDFGFCVYVGDCDGVYEDEEGRLIGGPVFAPEINKTKRYTTKSDVWSMGMLVWDAYYTASLTGVYGSFLDMVRTDALKSFTIFGRFPMPSRCPSNIQYYVENELLDSDPDQRPSFTDIKRKISAQILRTI